MSIFIRKLETLSRYGSRSLPKFVHWPIAILPWKFHENPFGSCWAKLLTDRQKNRQADRQTTMITWPPWRT